MPLVKKASLERKAGNEWIFMLQKILHLFFHTFGFFEFAIFYTGHYKFLFIFHVNNPNSSLILFYFKHFCDFLVIVFTFDKFSHICREQLLCSISDMINKLAVLGEKRPVFVAIH